MVLDKGKTEQVEGQIPLRLCSYQLLRQKGQIFLVILVESVRAECCEPSEINVIFLMVSV